MYHHRPANVPKFKSKIVGGRLVTCQVYDTFDDLDNNQNNRFPSPASRYSNTHAVTDDNSLRELSNVRLEAQRNKARAFAQTYQSVLSPPAYGCATSPRTDRNTQYDKPSPNKSSQETNALIAGVVSSIATLSRHRLLSAFSAMRRLDPREDGLLTMFEVQDTMAIHNIYLDVETKERLFGRFSVGEGLLEYRQLWKFFMECYAHKDQIDVPTREQQNIYSSVPSNDALNHDHAQITPGIYAEVEHELRKYARTHQRCLETNLLQEMFLSLDRYGSGKILKSQVYSLCQQYLHGFDRNVLATVLNACDEQQSGLVNYKRLLMLLSNSQPTYLPPLDPTNRSLVSSDEANYVVLSNDISHHHNREDDRRRLFDYLQNLSTPPSSKDRGDVFNRYEEKRGSTVKRVNTTIPSGNSEQLEKIGNIGFHLSDFETEVHTRRASYSSCEENGRTSPSEKRPGTYDLSPKKQHTQAPMPQRPGTYDILSMNEEDTGNVERPGTFDLTPQVDNSSVNLSNRKKTTKPINKPKSKMVSNRKKWGDSSSSKVSTPKTGHDKWWKNDEMSHSEADGGGGDVQEKPQSRLTWGQSNHIRTVKSRRKRKTKKNLQKKAFKNNIPSSTATDSEFYTTTDVEVNENADHLWMSTDDEHPPNDDETSPRMILAEKPEDIKIGLAGKPEDIKSVLVGKTDDIENSKTTMIEVATLCEENNMAHNESVVQDVDAVNESKLRNSCEDNEVSQKQPRIVDVITESVQEKLKLESFSPQPEENVSTININGRAYILHPIGHGEKVGDNSAKNYKRMKLQLEWVYGFDSNIYLMTSQQFLVHVGRVVIVTNTANQHQRFFRRHTCDVSAICIHRKERIVASAQYWDGKKCIIHIWSVVDMATISTLHLDHFQQASITCMKFMNEEKQQPLLLMLMTAKTDDQLICVYNITNNEMKASIKISDVIGIVSTSGGQFATFGRHDHLRMHNYDEKNGTISSKNFSYGDMPVAKSVMCAVFNKNGDLVTGDQNGSIYLWPRSSLRIDHVIHNAHASSITGMCLTASGHLLTSSNKQCCVKVWDPFLKQAGDGYKIPSHLIGVRTIDVCDDLMVFGSVSNFIGQITLSSESNGLISNAVESFSILNEAHGDVVTGIACDPMYPEMLVTLAADGWLHMYNTNIKSTVFRVRVQGNGSCVIYHPHKEDIFVGCQDGSVHVLNSTTGGFVDKFKDVFVAIACMQFSPDGRLLLCGSMDGDLLMYFYDSETKELEYRDCTKIFNQQGSVQSIDWDKSQKFVRVQSSLFGMKYYDIEESSEIENKSNVNWATNTCSVAYESKGLWDDATTKTATPVFDVLQCKKIMAYVTSQKLCLAEYPCLHPKELLCHSSYTTSGCYGSRAPWRSRLSCNGSVLYVSYDRAGCLWQWKIVDDEPT